MVRSVLLSPLSKTFCLLGCGCDFDDEIHKTFQCLSSPSLALIYVMANEFLRGVQRVSLSLSLSLSLFTFVAAIPSHLYVMVTLTLDVSCKFFVVRGQSLTSCTTRSVLKAFDCEILMTTLHGMRYAVCSETTVNLYLYVL